MRDKKQTAIWMTAGLLGLFVFIKFYFSAFPSASVDMNLSRTDAVVKAREFLTARGFDLRGFDSAALFISDFSGSVYLQKYTGIKRTNELVKDGMPIWFWQVRFFKELDKEGYFVSINPSSGRVDRFEHNILDDKPGADIEQAKARLIAEQELSRRGVDLNNYQLKESITKKQKNRTDHYFSWERNNFSIVEAKYRIAVSVQGESLASYSEYLKLPEDFYRMLGKEKSFGDVMTMLSGTFLFVFTIVAMILMVRKNRLLSEQLWRTPFVLGVICAILSFLNYINEFTLQWSFYPDNISKALFVTSNFSSAVHSVFITAAIIFAYSLLGVVMLNGREKELLPVMSACDKDKPGFIGRCLIGYSLAFCFLGYITVFYIFSSKMFHVWMPPNTAYSNLLATSMPFLFSLTIGVTAAVNEEFTYRVFMTRFLRDWCGLKYLAVLLPAFVWAMGHSSYSVYPSYMRAIELTIFGVAMTLVFLRYGLETVIIAHFTINALLGALPLLRSHNRLFQVHGAIVLLLAAVPLVWMRYAGPLRALFLKMFYRRA